MHERLTGGRDNAVGARYPVLGYRKRVAVNRDSPVLCVVPEYAGIVKLTVPLPLPLLPEVIVTQSGLLFVAVQLHPVCAVTVIEPVPTDALNGWLIEESV